MFKSHQKGGFSITYPNNITISVQFKYGNYCSTNAKSYDYKDVIEAENAEIAIWDESDSNMWITQEVIREALNEEISDDVYGYVSPLDLLKIQNHISEMK